MTVLTRSRRIGCVVIGTSAGGIEALSLILPALRSDMRASVVIVLHLPREEPSALAEIFGPKCALPVRKVGEKETIEPGTVYFAPPNYHVLIEKGPAFALSVDDPVNFSRPSIDVLFESAADIYGKHLMGVILTGANEDGARGLVAVQRAGGITVVQQPETARSPLMAEAALKRISADFVLSLKDIAEIMQMTENGNRRNFEVQLKATR